MTDKKSSESRRKLLKSIAAGSGVFIAGKSLPDKWRKPVVDSVVLPAHAQSSPPALTYSCSVTGQATIDINVVAVPGPIEYTITNTGTGPLTGGGANVLSNTGTIGGLIFTEALPAVPDPMAPGATVVVSLTNIGFATCPFPGGGAGIIEIGFSSNETACGQLVDVTCVTIG